ncbi:hypothetical protein MBEHAL_0505 [Halarchaeum acidiphilum MH1-52-1]|uniref:Uncharacterized protein n=1 Tax=Halarchaeum acidiphilum MH1-52-1 TaxID=1261545 RepID=U2YRX2_9EURY|nr:hypothetical protein MBEHAL_0505 [Halarchaeum acidiphilum MH1-52-1]
MLLAESAAAEATAIGHPHLRSTAVTRRHCPTPRTARG